MAEALLRQMAGDRFEIHSAGTSPKGIHPQTVVAMKEAGIDVSGQRSKDVREFEGQKFDYVITVCDRAKQVCPIFPGSEPLHWGFEDPADAPPEKQARTFMIVRDEIKRRLSLFLASENRGPTPRFG